MSEFGLSKEVLENMICNRPNCDHTAHEDFMEIHSNCHIESPVLILRTDFNLGIICSECHEYICRICIAKVYPSTNSYWQECDVEEKSENKITMYELFANCHASDFLVYYRKGVLTVNCAACEAEICKIDVASELNSVGKN